MATPRSGSPAPAAFETRLLRGQGELLPVVVVNAWKGGVAAFRTAANTRLHDPGSRPRTWTMTSSGMTTS